MSFFEGCAFGTLPIMTPPRQKKALLAWSGGKDAAMALWRLQQDPTVSVVGLFTTITEGTRRMPIHGVSEALLKLQADAVGLPLALLALPPNCPNVEYEKRLGALLFEAKRDLGISAAGFGDLFLKEIRTYRETFLAPMGLAPLFPLWGDDTEAMAQANQRAGFKSRIVSVWQGKIKEEWLARDFDEAFRAANRNVDLDPCGENGEFHTFTYAGPNFKAEIKTAPGEIHTEGPYRWIELASLRTP